VKYVTVIKTHVFGAHADDGAGGAVNPRRFWWSARNNAADWQPGSSRAGFGEVRPDAGDITGVVGFEDYGVLFCTHSIYRIDYIGGDNVWSLRQIGSAIDGLPAIYQDSIGVAGSTIFYWSRTGPKAVLAGEEVVQLGVEAVQRYAVDVESTRANATPGNASMFGAADSDRTIMAWDFLDENGGRRTLLYNFGESVWSVGDSMFRANTTPFGMASRPSPPSVFPAPRHLNGIDSVEKTAGVATAVVTRPDVYHTAAQTLKTRRWSPLSGFRSQVHGIRLHWRAINSGGVDLDYGSAPGQVVTINLLLSNDIHFTTMTTIVFDTRIENRDGNGFIVTPVSGGTLPAEAQFIQAEVVFPADFAGARSFYESLVGLELLITQGTAVY
jgi:hypothetical protein